MTTETFDLTPTPEGLALIVEAFREQITKSYALINRADKYLDILGLVPVPSSELSYQAYKAIVNQELNRIDSMREGIRAAGGEV